MQAGITLQKLSDDLDQRGLALENIGDIAYQTIAGATSTATHGTGTTFGNISSRIVGLRLVTGDGSVLDCSADENAEVFDVARVGLGALGILSTVTLQCVPAFHLHAVEEPMPVDDVLADFDGFMTLDRPLRVLLGAPHPLGADQAQQPHAASRPRPASGRRSISTTSY